MHLPIETMLRSHIAAKRAILRTASAVEGPQRLKLRIALAKAAHAADRRLALPEADEAAIVAVVAGIIVRAPGVILR
jgi:hypothetical protein